MSKQVTAQAHGAYPSNVSDPLFVSTFDRFCLVEHFERKPGINADIQNSSEATRMVANPNFEVLGTNGTSALCTLSTRGGVTLTTAGASADQMILAPHLDTNQTAWSVADWSTDDEVAHLVGMYTGASIADVTIWIGLKLTNTSVTATDDDQAFFRYEPSTNGGKWQCIHSNDGTDVTGDSGVEVAAATKYKLRIAIDTNRFVHYFINGDHVYTSSAALATAHDLIPYIGVQADTGSAKAIDVLGCAISKTTNS